MSVEIDCISLSFEMKYSCLKITPCPYFAMWICVLPERIELLIYLYIRQNLPEENVSMFNV